MRLKAWQITARATSFAKTNGWDRAAQDLDRDDAEIKHGALQIRRLAPKPVKPPTTIQTRRRDELLGIPLMLRKRKLIDAGAEKYPCEIIFGPSIAGEADSFFQCAKCKTWIDCRQLEELIAHEAWCTGGKNRTPMPGRRSQ
jgi:hypothetical protein